MPPARGARAGDPGSGDGSSFSPVFLSYVVGPVAFCVLMFFRAFGLVADLPVWAYFLAIMGPALISIIMEPWNTAPPGSLRFHIRVGVHIAHVTLVIYMTGWGPALGMAYAFVALEELQQWGAAAWRPIMTWSLFNIFVAQYLLWWGLTPSFLTRPQAETIGVLGTFVLVIVVRMAGVTGVKKEEAERQLAHQARHDILTGLPNRGYFYDRTTQVLEIAAAEGTRCAVMLFDLDRFKEINDTMGHRYGDEVLIEVGPRVRSVLRDGDVLARLGGDEFCVLLPGVGADNDPVRVAERIIETLEEPIEVDGVNLGIEASCGISLSPEDGDSADLLLQRADLAMYVAKESQQNVVVYSDDLNSATPASLTLLGDLRNAMNREEFVLHYQPKADMTTLEVRGVEALIRWCHPTRGLLMPDQFIPEAERTGLIEPMTTWVLDAALRQCREWADRAGARGGGPLGRGQPLDAQPARRLAPGHGGRRPRPLAGTRIPARARDHRDDHHDRPETGAEGAHRPGGDGTDPLDRRLRHRLLVAGQAPRAPGDPTQDRPRVRHGHGQRRRRCGDRSVGHRPRGQPRSADGGRGCRGCNHLGAADRAGVRQRTGLLPRPADGRGALRPVACDASCSTGLGTDACTDGRRCERTDVTGGRAR